MLKPFQSFRRNDALNFWSGAKAKPKKLPLLWSRHRTLRFVHFELEFVRDEARDALHHSLTGPLAAHVDVAIIRVANVAVATTLQLSVEFAWLLVRWGDNLWVPIGLHVSMNLWCEIFACDRAVGSWHNNIGRVLTVLFALAITIVRNWVRRIGT